MICKATPHDTTITKPLLALVQTLFTTDILTSALADLVSVGLNVTCFLLRRFCFPARVFKGKPLLLLKCFQFRPLYARQTQMSCEKRSGAGSPRYLGCGQVTRRTHSRSRDGVIKIDD